MNAGRIQPQISQMNADIFLNAIICANVPLASLRDSLTFTISAVLRLRNLRMNNSPVRDLSAVAQRAKEGMDKALVEILEKIGV